MTFLVYLLQKLLKKLWKLYIIIKKGKPKLAIKLLENEP